MRKRQCLWAAVLSCALLTDVAPAAGLHHPLETAIPTRFATQKFLNWVNQAVANPTNPPYGFTAFHAALAYKVTGNAAYASLAVSMVDATVTADTLAAQGGTRPSIAADSYLGVFSGIRDVTYTLQWCNAQISATQKTSWESYCSQAIYNVWN